MKAKTLHGTGIEEIESKIKISLCDRQAVETPRQLTNSAMNQKIFFIIIASCLGNTLQSTHAQIMATEKVRLTSTCPWGQELAVVSGNSVPALLGVEALDAIWVLYWFDRNDTPERRSILQVHPRANPENPLRGVFATRAPVRPNLIALSRCRIISVKDNIIEIDGIDAFPDTPVLDIKP